MNIYKVGARYIVFKCYLKPTKWIYLGIKTKTQNNACSKNLSINM